MDKFRPPLFSCTTVCAELLSVWPDLVWDVQVKPFATKKNEIIPKAGCEDMLRELHVYEDHPGGTRMKRLPCMFLWWPGLDHDIEQKVKGCRVCKTYWPNPPLAPLIPQKWPSEPWSHLHIDLWDSSEARTS